MKRKYKIKKIILIATICCLGLTWLFTGGLVFREIEEYHFETKRVSDTELFFCYLRGETSKDIEVPFLFRYVKSLRPFKLFFQYHCDEKLYDEITIDSVTLLTSDKQELILSGDELPITGKFKSQQWPGEQVYYQCNLFFKTSLDIQFEKVDRIDLVVEMTLKKDGEGKPYKIEGVLKRHHTDNVGKYWDEFGM